MDLLIDTCVFIDAFDPESPNHNSSIRLLEELRQRDILVKMPASAWFEIWCTAQRLTNQAKFAGPTIAGVMAYPIQLIHIDDKFIRKYSMADVPYIKAGDHIFVAMAKTNGWTLITSDAQMGRVSRECGVDVCSPGEFLNRLAGN